MRFRPYGDSLFLQTPKKSKQKNACSYVRPARWGSGFLRCGIDPGAAPTVCCAAPPLAVFGFAKRSLRSHPRINPSTQPSDVACGSRSRSRAGELILGLLSGEEHGFRLWICGVFAPHRNAARPALFRGRGGRFVSLSESGLDSVSHVGLPLPITSISPLSLRERVRVRGF